MLEKNNFPAIHFYDQDFVDIYNQSWVWVEKSLKQGSRKNGLKGKFINHAKSNTIKQNEVCLATFFLVYSNSNYSPLPLLENFYNRQEEDGAIRCEYSLTDGSPCFKTDNPQSLGMPLFAWAEYNLFHKVGDKKRLRDTVIPVLVAYYQWIENNFQQANGLYSAPLSVMEMENSPRQDCFYPIDFNALMAINALYLAKLGSLVNDKDIIFMFKKRYFTLKNRITNLMWNEETGNYMDLSKNEKQLPTLLLSAYWMLLSEIPDKERIVRMVAMLKDPQKFGAANPFPTLAMDDPQFSEDGHGFCGSVYPYMTYIVVKGLERYGYYTFARECAIRHIYFILDSLHSADKKKSGDVYEAYLPNREGKAILPESDTFPRKGHYISVLLATIAMMIENVIGISLSLPRKTVDWILPTMEIMGIEDLALKRNFITIMSNKSGRGWEIRLESEKLYYFTVDILNQNKRKTLPIPSGKCSMLIDKL